MRIRKSPWGRYGSRRWPAWDTLETPAWVPVRCSFRRGARRAEDTRRRILSSPGLDQAQDIPWRLAAPPTGGRRHIWVKIPNAARTGQRWAGWGLCRDTQPGKKKPAQSLVGRAESGPGAPVEAGPTPQRVGGGGPRRECRAVGTGRGYSGPAPAQVANGRGGAG